MRFDNLTIKNFSCFRNLNMSFERKINLVFGQNATGKSSIALAIELLLTSRISGSPVDFRDRFLLRRDGLKMISVFGCNKKGKRDSGGYTNSQ